MTTEADTQTLSLSRGKFLRGGLYALIGTYIVGSGTGLFSGWIDKFDSSNDRQDAANLSKYLLTIRDVRNAFEGESKIKYDEFDNAILDYYKACCKNHGDGDSELTKEAADSLLKFDQYMPGPGNNGNFEESWGIFTSSDVMNSLKKLAVSDSSAANQLRAQVRVETDEDKKSFVQCLADFVREQSIIEVRRR